MQCVRGWKDTTMATPGPSMMCLRTTIPCLTICPIILTTTPHLICANSCRMKTRNMSILILLLHYPQLWSQLLFLFERRRLRALTKTSLHSFVPPPSRFASSPIVLLGPLRWPIPPLKYQIRAKSCLATAHRTSRNRCPHTWSELATDGVVVGTTLR